MSRYIDADELYKTIRAKMRSCDTDTDYGRGIQQGFDFAMDEIRQQPEADVVEIVRCKDCIYGGDYDFFNCCYHGTKMTRDDFCCCAEREESDDEH